MGSKRDFWASSKFQNSPSQTPCLFRPSRHRLPYSERQAFPGRFFFKQVKWLVISPAVPRLKFLSVVLSSRPSGVLFFQNAWTGIDQFIPLISTLALTCWDIFFSITLFPRRLVLVFMPILITSPSFSVSTFEASCEAVASPPFITFRVQSLPIQCFPILAASFLSPLDPLLSTNAPRSVHVGHIPNGIVGRHRVPERRRAPGRHRVPQSARAPQSAMAMLSSSHKYIANFLRKYQIIVPVTERVHIERMTIVEHCKTI